MVFECGMVCGGDLVRFSFNRVVLVSTRSIYIAQLAYAERAVRTIAHPTSGPILNAGSLGSRMSFWDTYNP